MVLLPGVVYKFPGVPEQVPGLNWKFSYMIYINIFIYRLLTSVVSHIKLSFIRDKTFVTIHNA